MFIRYLFAAVAFSTVAMAVCEQSTSSVRTKSSPPSSVRRLKSKTTNEIAIDEVEESLNDATKYLVKDVQADGRFVYRRNMDPNIQPTPQYNILRHAGTIYALAGQQGRAPKKTTQDAITKAATYLRDVAIGPVDGHENMQAVWSDPKVNGTTDPFQAKLGGSGLGLVALLSVEKIEPGFTPVSKLQDVARFILFLQKPDGSFHSKYIPSSNRFDEWVSLYYPGEAALGLLMLYEVDGKEQWLDAAAKALTFLATSRKDQWDVPPDHWALLATEKLLSIDHPIVLSKRKLLTTHAVQICNTIIRDRFGSKTAPPEYYGGFTADGRTTPAATRLEGLLAAVNFVPKEHEMYPVLQIAIRDGMKFLLRSQIREGNFKGAFPRAIARIAEVTPSMPDFNQRATEVRIDYVQHAISAMTQYIEYAASRR